MSILTKTQILEANDLTTKKVAVSEWGGDVMIRTMTGTERDAFEISLFDSKGNSMKTNMTNMRAKLLAQCLVGEDGNKIFDEKEIIKLGSKSAKILDRLYTIARDLNGIGAEDEEELVKN